MFFFSIQRYIGAASTRSCYLIFIILLVLQISSFCSAAVMRDCKRVGTEEIVDEENCDLLIVRVNRCSGYCISLTYPNLLTGKMAGYQNCCRMTDSEWVNTELNCKDGVRQIRIPSALECACFDCVKS